jgi:hypothetical protein
MSECGQRANFKAMEELTAQLQCSISRRNVKCLDATLFPPQTLPYNSRRAVTFARATKKKYEGGDLKERNPSRSSDNTHRSLPLSGHLDKFRISNEAIMFLP